MILAKLFNLLVPQRPVEWIAMEQDHSRARANVVVRYLDSADNFL
jgi:hypothetical protein